MVTCGDRLMWTCCLLMACKRSGVRIPLAPLFGCSSRSGACWHSNLLLSPGHDLAIFPVTVRNSYWSPGCAERLRAVQSLPHGLAGVLRVLAAQAASGAGSGVCLRLRMAEGSQTGSTSRRGEGCREPQETGLARWQITALADRGRPPEFPGRVSGHGG